MKLEVDLTTGQPIVTRVLARDGHWYRREGECCGCGECCPNCPNLKDNKCLLQNNPWGKPWVCALSPYEPTEILDKDCSYTWIKEE